MILLRKSELEGKIVTTGTVPPAREMAALMDQFIPAIPLLKITDGGEPWLAGSRCRKCDAIFPGDRAVCASCGDRHSIESIRLAQRGTLYNFTVVYRSFSGVKTPFVAAIVDLEGGGSLRGTLLEVEPDPEKLRRDMPVKIVFRDTGQTNQEGRAFLAYYFITAEEPGS